MLFRFSHLVLAPGCIWNTTRMIWIYIGIFYRATACNAKHGIAKAFVSVRLSVCLSVCQTRALWQHEINLCLHSYTTWKIVHPSFLTRRMVGGGRPLLPAILGINPGPQAWVQNERRRGEGRDRAFTLSLHAPIDSLQELSLVYSHFVDVQFRHELCVFIDEPSLAKNVRSRMSQLHAAHYTQFSK